MSRALKVNNLLNQTEHIKGDDRSKGEDFKVNTETANVLTTEFCD